MCVYSCLSVGCAPPTCCFVVLKMFGRWSTKGVTPGVAILDISVLPLNIHDDRYQHGIENEPYLYGRDSPNQFWENPFPCNTCHMAKQYSLVDSCPCPAANIGPSRIICQIGDMQNGISDTEEREVRDVISYYRIGNLESLGPIRSIPTRQPNVDRIIGSRPPSRFARYLRNKMEIMEPNHICMNILVWVPKPK